MQPFPIMDHFYFDRNSKIYNHCVGRRFSVLHIAFFISIEITAITAAQRKGTDQPANKSAQPSYHSTTQKKRLTNSPPNRTLLHRKRDRNTPRSNRHPRNPPQIIHPQQQLPKRRTSFIFRIPDLSENIALLAINSHHVLSDSVASRSELFASC